MKYMLLIYYPNTSQEPDYKSEQFQAAQQAWAKVLEDMKSSGVWLSNHGLAPVSDATTVRVRDGKTVTADGPYAETHEQLGGLYLLDCKDLDEAIGWAAKVPGAQYGSIEVRPLNKWSQ